MSQETYRETSMLVNVVPGVRPRLWEDSAVSGGVVRVFSTNQIFEGHLTKARLEDEGIPVMLKGEGEGPYRMGPVHLFVAEGLEVQARALIEAIARGDYAVGSVEAEEEPER
jgi:hypothetical protein